MPRVMVTNHLVLIMLSCKINDLENYSKLNVPGIYLKSILLQELRANMLLEQCAFNFDLENLFKITYCPRP